jgi:GNAT superfamily N-acetyltransferase
MRKKLGQTSGALSFSRVRQYSSRHFRDAMRLYRAEFPDTALPLTRVRQLLLSGRYQLFVAEADGTVCAFALVWVCPRPAFVHLDYMAVAQERRGRGAGTALYRWLIARLADVAPRASLLTLEVEDHLVPFYRRSGTRVLRDVPYLFPGARGPLPFNLMAHDLRGRTTLDGSVVQDIIRALYRGLHGRGGRDPVLCSFLPRVPARVAVV